MQPITATDPISKSADLTADNLGKLQKLFPDAFIEGKINFEVLKQLLGGAVEEREEKYGLNWHGKRAARRLALTPSTGTLRPGTKEESRDWDSTRNLVIEGDNLEVLKLLQKSYTGKVKLIYIDPPYNTGNDFVYPDDFSDGIGNYKEITGQTKNGVSQTSKSNNETNGRFHTEWLNMMYSRLRLARNLLQENGIILISCDEKESDNLKQVGNEIFGEENFIERIVWKNKYGAGALTKGFANVHEYILVYSKTPIQDIAAPLNDEQKEGYNLRDDKFHTRGGYITQPVATTSKDDRPNLVYPLLHNGKEIWPDKQWIWSKERLESAYKNNELVINESNGKFSVRSKQYVRDENGIERLGKPLSIMNGPFNQEGTKEIDTLFKSKIFTFPKPLKLIQYFIALVIDGDKTNSGIYMDFFAGSGTTGHAVMAQNAADGGTRRYICVQLPEPTRTPKENGLYDTSPAWLAGYPTIAEITKARLRRAADKIREENPLFAGDLGFRVYKLDSTNVREWEPDRANIEKTLEEHAAGTLKPDRTEADVLTELLLKLGLDLCTPVLTRTIAGKTAYSVGSGTLYACLDRSIATADIEPLAAGLADWHKEQSPDGEPTVLFRDDAFADDITKTNLTAILEQRGLKNIRSL